MIVVNGTKAAQLLAFLERCAHLDADVQSSVERGFFTVTIPPPRGTVRLAKRPRQYRIRSRNGQSSTPMWCAIALTATAHYFMCCDTV